MSLLTSLVSLGGRFGCYVTMTLLCVAAGWDAHAQAQQSESPLARSLAAPLPLPVQTFMSTDYTAGGQNWSVVEDDDGVIYVANNSGVLTYDGGHWLDVVPMDNGGIARSLVRTSSGRIVLGGASELGIVEPQAGLPPLYRAITHELPDSLQGFGDAWRGLAVGDAAAFVLSRSILFVRADDSILAWTKPHVSTRAVLARDTLFLASPIDGAPVMAYLDGEVRVVDSDLGRLIQRERARYTAHLDGVDYLLGQSALLAVSADTIRTLDAFPVADVQAVWPYGMTAAPGGALVVSTIEGGAFVTDTSGRLLRQVTRASGLPENVTQCAFVDSAGALWVCHDLGVSRVQLMAPLRTLRTPDVPISANDAALAGDTVHVLNVSGLTSFTLTQDGIDVHRTEKILDGRRLLQTPHGLLAAHSRGVLSIRAGRTDSLAIPGDIYPYTEELVPADDSGARVVAGIDGGPCLLRFERNQWRVGNCLRELGVPSITRGVRGVEGDVWLGSNFQGVLRLRYDAQADSLALVAHYTDTLLTNRSVVPLRIADALYLKADTVLRWQGTAFETDTSRLTSLLASDTTSLLRTTGRGRIASMGEKRLSLITPGPPPRSIDLMHDRLNSKELLEVLDLPDGRFLTMNLLSLSLVAPDLIGALPVPLAPRLSFVRHIGPDTLVSSLKPFTPEQRDLSFAYATLAADLSGATLYRTRMSGYEDEWSAWSPAGERVFTNLPHGSYALEMQARDAWGRDTEVRTATFHIAPKWFQTWWANLLFLGLSTLLLAFVVSRIVRWRGRQLSERNAILESLVAERTADLERQALTQQRLNERLSESNQKLEDASEQKTALLGIAAHDLRNPIANVKSLAELLRMDLPDDMDEPRELVDLIHESSDAMLRLIEDLLRSNEAERGALKMNMEPLDMADIGRAAVETTRARASVKEQRIEWEGMPSVACGDGSRVRDVMFNLLSNAVKYSPRGSILRARVRCDSGFARFSVTDQGPGLTEADHAHLFHPFKKLSARPTEGESSTGLGLFIVRQYVEQMGGRVGADSVLGQGSTFWFELPLVAKEKEAVANSSSSVSSEALRPQSASGSEACSGSVTTNVLPSCGPSSTAMEPPCRSAMRRQTANPMPDPA